MAIWRFLCRHLGHRFRRIGDLGVCRRCGFIGAHYIGDPRGPRPPPEEYE